MTEGDATATLEGSTEEAAEEDTDVSDETTDGSEESAVEEVALDEDTTAEL